MRKSRVKKAIALNPASTDVAVAAQAARLPAIWDARKGRKKKRYTKGTKLLQRAGFGGIKASYRISDAVATGLDRFYKRSRRSSRKRRDGLLKDLLDNSAKGFRVTAREIGKAPYDFTRRINVKPFLRLILG
jgi:hypothetical protein